MKVQIGNLRNKLGKIDLVLDITDYGSRRGLEETIEKLFLNSVNHILHDHYERGGKRKKEIHYWGRSSLFLEGRIYCTAKYNREDVKVKLRMRKNSMLNYFERLENLDGVDIVQDYKSLLSKFD